MTLQELGQSIREKRTAVGLSIDDVAGRIKVSGRILKSIEEGSLVGLPHAVYTKSFIRAFGLQVGYDPKELTERLEILFPPESLDETRNEPGPRTRTLQVSSGNGRNIVILLFVVIILGMLAAGGWFVVRNYGDMIFNLVKTPFSAITTPPSESDPNERHQAFSKYAPSSALQARNASVDPTGPIAASSPTTAQAAGASSPLQSPGGGLQPALPQTVSSNPTAPALAGVVASAPGNAVGQTVMARPDEKKRLQIVAEQPCWISFRADGVKGRDYTLQPKEDFILTYERSLEITFGNAGGVTMVHNGRDIGKPGRAGQRAVVSFPRPGE